MKLEVLQENLVTKLNNLYKIVPTNPQLPILSTILLSTQKNQLSLAATDLYIGMRATVSAKTIEAGSIAVPGKLFRETIASLDPGKISLTLNKQSLLIKTDSSTTTLQCMPTEEFPEFPDVAGQKISLKTTELSQIVESVGFSASLDQTRPVLTGLLFEFGEKKLKIVSTDGFRLAILEMLQMEKDLKSVIVPAKGLAYIKQLINQEQEVKSISLIISQEQKQILAEIGETTLFIRIIEGEYPPYNKIIPTSFTTQINLDKHQLTKLLKRALIFARESSNIVRLEIQKDQVLIKASSSAHGMQEGQMPARVIKLGDDKTIAFNIHYLLDFLEAVQEEEVILSMNQSLTPAQLTISGQPDYQYIIMPFRVHE